MPFRHPGAPLATSLAQSRTVLGRPGEVHSQVPGAETYVRSGCAILRGMSTLWDEVRRDFPGLAGKCYLNAAATSLTPRPVREAVQGFYRELEMGGELFWDAWIADHI